MNIDLAKAAALLRRAAKLIEQRAQHRWDGCVDRDGKGFSCIDISCGDSGSGQCRREWQELVKTAKGLRRLCAPAAKAGRRR